MYQLDIELWPTSLVIPAGYTIAVSVRGNDYVYDGPDETATDTIASFKNRFTGCGPFIHDDPVDRPAAVFAGTTTIHCGEGLENSVLLPVIPPLDG